VTRGPGSTGHTVCVPDVRCEKSGVRTAAQDSVPLWGHCRKQKDIFKANAVATRRPTRGPTKPPGVGVVGQSAAETDMAVDVIEGD
jgi:hypothetical protein